MAEVVGFEPTVPLGTSVFKTGALNQTLPHFRYLFLDLYVSSCESQLEHTNLRFSSLLSLLTPFIWSRINGIGLPFQTGSIPQQEQLYGINSFFNILFLRACLAYVEFSTKTDSRGYLSSHILLLPNFLPFNGLGLPVVHPALGERLCAILSGFSLHDI